MKKRKKHSQIVTTRIIMAGFVIGIIIGTLLLYMPISTRNEISMEDAFFMATSSVCVTGLATVNVGQTFNLLGQIILLILIEIGGLGVITFTVLVMLMFGRKISLTNRMLIQNAYNTQSMTGLIKLTKKIIYSSLTIELIGAFLYSVVFVKEYGVKGIWYSLFTSVSAFCNAGIDLFGGNSLEIYRSNWIVNFTTMGLIIAGGIGFPVYWEIGRLFNRKKEGFKKKMSTGAKIAISSTVILILAGTILTLIFEWSNPFTIGNLSTEDKVLASLFQSVTLRTAGFATIDQAGFHSSSCLVYLFLMLVGGSPAGTAGGIKTVTIVVLGATMVSNIKGSAHVNIFGRQIEDEYIKSCSAIASFSLCTLFTLTALLMFVQKANFIDALYEMTSAVATVGLSRGMTGDLGTLGKIIVCLTMYLGRIGPITIALSFNHKKISEISYASDVLTLG